MAAKKPLFHAAVRLQQRHLWRFVLLAFLLNALLPFFAVYDASAMSANAGHPSLFGRILICTGDGFRWIDRSDAGKQAPHSPDKHIECALCYFAAHGLKHLTLFAGVLLAYALRMRIAEAFAACGGTWRSYRSQFQRSRAPPCISL